MKTAVDIFTQLGERLAGFGKDARSCRAMADAIADNAWFAADDILMAVDAIRRDMLQREALQRWLSSYTPALRPKRVAVVMAGNIPLVGFFDMLCVVAGGHRAIVKPSGKDRALMLCIIELLREIEPEIAIDTCDNESLDAANADAVIATGNDNAKRYFKARFADKPQLLRGSRHSVAVLSGTETSAELKLLQSDIFSYSGLGCRNVSMVFVPRGCEFRLPESRVNPKLYNNYLQNRALLRMAGAEFVDTGSCLLIKGDDFPSALSRVAVNEYDTLAEVSEWLLSHDNELQCVVSECIDHPRRVSFGQSQHPGLTDYPDAVDVMDFLSGI